MLQLRFLSCCWELLIWWDWGWLLWLPTSKWLVWAFVLQFHCLALGLMGWSWFVRFHIGCQPLGVHLLLSVIMGFVVGIASGLVFFYLCWCSAIVSKRFFVLLDLWICAACWLMMSSPLRFSNKFLTTHSPKTANRLVLAFCCRLFIHREVVVICPVGGIDIALQVVPVLTCCL